jgi:NADH-quinone oxidoreductase subunit H
VPGIGGFLAGVIGESSPLWIALKVFILVSILVAVRATLPRLRYDQLMDLGWKRLIPASLLWLLVLAASRVGTTWIERARNIAVAFAGTLIAAGLLWAAMQVGRRTAEAEDAEAVAKTVGSTPGARAGRL